LAAANSSTGAAIPRAGLMINDPVSVGRVSVDPVSVDPVSVGRVSVGRVSVGRVVDSESPPV